MLLAPLDQPERRAKQARKGFKGLKGRTEWMALRVHQALMAQMGRKDPWAPKVRQERRVLKAQPGPMEPRTPRASWRRRCDRTPRASWR